MQSLRGRGRERGGHDYEKKTNAYMDHGGNTRNEPFKRMFQKLRTGENTTTAGSAVSSSAETKTSETSGNNDLKVVREAVMSNNLDQWHCNHRNGKRIF